MRQVITWAVGFGVVVLALAPANGQAPAPSSPNPDSQYRLGPDSLPQEGVPKGEMRGPYTLPSQVYPAPSTPTGCTSRSSTTQPSRRR